MIKDRKIKIEKIVTTIQARICEINNIYKKRPDFYFYQRLLQLRSQSPDIESFLKSDHHLEIIYATLITWGMNSRAAKIKYFCEFKTNILSCLEEFKQIEALGKNPSYELLHNPLDKVYRHLHVMESDARLVSNSKTLHFLFPNLLIPMDGLHTLTYFYRNTDEPEGRYMELIKVSFDILEIMSKDSGGSWRKYLGIEWNTTVPKMIDNAITLLTPAGKSLNR